MRSYEQSTFLPYLHTYCVFINGLQFKNIEDFRFGLCRWMICVVKYKPLSCGYYGNTSTRWRLSNCHEPLNSNSLQQKYWIYIHNYIISYYIAITADRAPFADKGALQDSCCIMCNYVRAYKFVIGCYFVNRRVRILYTCIYIRNRWKRSTITPTRGRRNNIIVTKFWNFRLSKGWNNKNNNMFPISPGGQTKSCKGRGDSENRTARCRWAHPK